ncbi:androgen-induced gene 1 protein isoform X1 [Anabrus simplex]|uniref:androgen-induced gene 1 protein isoform X1 n=1 Tax=Anabrus simplex TaxID=316456 RepID=UPI0034DDAC86
MAGNKGNRQETSPPSNNSLLLLIHVIGAVQFSFSVYYDWNFVKIPREASRMGSGYGGKLKFLTFWDAILQAVYFTVCLANDFLGSNEVNPKKVPFIRKLKDYMYCSVAFPVAMFVGLTFWGLMAIDRELVFPKALDPYFPGWLNHVMHTNIMIFTVIEMLVTFRQYPTRSKGLAGLTGFMCIYLVWTHVIYFKSGEWVYPVLDVLNWGQRVVFFVALLMLGNILYIAGEFLNNTVWAKELTARQGGSGRKKAH